MHPFDTRPTQMQNKIHRFLCLLVAGIVITACQPPEQVFLRTTRVPEHRTASASTSAPNTPAVPAATLPGREAAQQTVAPLPATLPATPDAPLPTPQPTRTQPPAAFSATQADAPVATPTIDYEPMVDIPSASGKDPFYFPGPGDPLESWQSVAGGITAPDVQWAEYSGPVDSSTPGTPANLTFRHPAQWTIDSQTSSRIITRSPENSGQAGAEQVKFQVMPQPDRPNITSKQAGAFEPHAVEIAGEPGVLIVYTQEPGKRQVLSAIFEHNRAWYIAVGTIQLEQPDQARMDELRALVFEMFQSMRISP